MVSRSKYTPRDERLMWEFLYEQLQKGTEAALTPKGKKIWGYFEQTKLTDKSAASLATHFRRQMYSNIEKANLPVDQMLYVANKIEIPLTSNQRRVIEHKFNVKIEQNHLTVVTAYTYEGNRYVFPTDLERQNESTDSERQTSPGAGMAEEIVGAVNKDELRSQRLPSAEILSTTTEKTRTPIRDEHCAISDERSDTSLEIEEVNGTVTNPALCKVLELLGDETTDMAESLQSGDELSPDKDKSSENDREKTTHSANSLVISTDKSNNSTISLSNAEGKIEDTTTGLNRRVNRNNVVVVDSDNDSSIKVLPQECVSSTTSGNGNTANESVVQERSPEADEIIQRDQHRVSLKRIRKHDLESSKQKGIQPETQTENRNVTVRTKLRRFVHSEVFFKLIHESRNNDEATESTRMLGFIPEDESAVKMKQLRPKKRGLPVSCRKFRTSRVDSNLDEECWEPVAGPSTEVTEKSLEASESIATKAINTVGKNVAYCRPVKTFTMHIPPSIRRLFSGHRGTVNGMMYGDSSSVIFADQIVPSFSRQSSTTIGHLGTGAGERTMSSPTKWLQKQKIDMGTMEHPLPLPSLTLVGRQALMAPSEHTYDTQCDEREIQMPSNQTTEECNLNALRNEVVKSNSTGIEKMAAFCTLDQLWSNAQRDNVEIMEYFKRAINSQRNSQAPD